MPGHTLGPNRVIFWRIVAPGGGGGDYYECVRGTIGPHGGTYVWWAVPTLREMVGRGHPTGNGGQCPPYGEWWAVATLREMVGRAHPTELGKNWWAVPTLREMVGRGHPTIRGPCPPYGEWWAVPTLREMVGGAHPTDD
jgi:hypothetical protein